MRDQISLGGFLNGCGLTLSGQGHLVEDCLFLRNGSSGMNHGADDTTIRNNVFVRNSAQGILAGGIDHNLIEGNVFIENGWDPNSASFIRGGLVLQSQPCHNLITKNIFTGHTFDATTAGLRIRSVNPGQGNLAVLNSFADNTLHVFDETGLAENNRYDDGRCGNFYQGFRPTSRALGTPGSCGPVYPVPFVFDSDSQDNRPLMPDPNR